MTKLFFGLHFSVQQFSRHILHNKCPKQSKDMGPKPERAKAGGPPCRYRQMEQFVKNQRVVSSVCNLLFVLVFVVFTDGVCSGLGSINFVTINCT